MARTAIALLSAALILVALPAFAQVNFGGTSALTIVADPAHPGPDSVVKLTVQSPLLDLQDSDVEWSVGGKPAGSGLSVSITLGNLGQETDVSVSVSGVSGNDSTQLAILPTSIDLLWEADSYVPPFYKGRAVPTSGSIIRVLAIPHFAEAGGSQIPVSNIDFTWKLNGAVDEGAVGHRRIVGNLPGGDPLWHRRHHRGRANTRRNSLRRVRDLRPHTRSRTRSLRRQPAFRRHVPPGARAIEQVASESETSFAAVPYFADATSANDPSLAYAWSVNDSPVATDPQDPSEITISAQSSGVAQIALSLSKPSDPFFSASGSWAVSFSATNAQQQSVFQTGQ